MGSNRCCKLPLIKPRPAEMRKGAVGSGIAAACCNAMGAAYSKATSNRPKWHGVSLVGRNHLDAIWLYSIQEKVWQHNSTISLCRKHQPCSAKV